MSADPETPDDDPAAPDDVPDDPFHDDEAHRGWIHRCEEVDRGDRCMHELDHDGPHQAIHEWEDAVPP